MFNTPILKVDRDTLPIEKRIFIFTCILGSATSFGLFLMDLLLYKSMFFAILDFIVFFIVVLFWFVGRPKNHYLQMAPPISYFVLLMASIGWATSRGAESSSNWAIINLLVTTAIGMLTQRQRMVYLTVVFLDFIFLGLFDYFYAVENVYYLSSSPKDYLNHFLYGLIITSSQIILVTFIKMRYDNERKIAQDQMAWLDMASSELEVQNEELSQQNEEITSQRDIIESANKKLTVQSEELNAAMEQIFDYNSNLEKMVEERTREVNELNKEIDMFMYRSSHDFRGPLMTLKGLTQVAQLVNDTQEHFNLWKKVEKTVEKSDWMLNKFVMISEINYYEEIEPMDIHFVIQYILDKLKTKLAGIEVISKIDLLNYPRIDLRNKLIGIILENIIENSAQYKSYDQPKITILVLEEGSDLIISINDNGIGIPENILDKVTLMYFRGNESSQGNGLGLYVVKMAVKRLNGLMMINSEEGLYTEVLISIPI